MNRNYMRGNFIGPAGNDFSVHDQEEQQQQEDPNQPAGGQQQQQQQQQVEPPDPFKGIDLDLLDDTTKAAITKAQGEFKTLHNDAKQKQTYQSELDRTKVELQRLQDEVKTGKQQQQQKQDDSTKTRTLADDAYDLLREAGIPEAEARKAAVLQAAISTKAIDTNNRHLEKALAPTFASVAETKLSNSFESAMLQMPAMQEHPETLAQSVWETAQAAVKNGVDMTPAAIIQLAKMQYFDLVQEGKIKPTTLAPVNNQQQQQQNRLTFPGAGSMVQRPQVGTLTKAAVNSDTQAALDATFGLMNKWSPTGQQQQGGQVKITRGA